MNRSSFLMLFSLVVLFGCASFSVEEMPNTTVHTAQIPASAKSELIAQINAAAAEHQWRGISVSIADSQSVRLEYALGWASENEKRPMTPNTASMVGSVTKLFTTTAIMTLVEQGMVRLDAPVTDYLPELADVRRSRIDLRTPTVRHLLYHHSGYQSDLLHGFVFGESPPNDWSRVFTELPQRSDDITQVHQPDTAMAYSNLSFSLLGVIIERVSGMPIDQYLQRALFSPMDMTSATFVPEDNQIKRMAYGLDGRQEIPYIYIRDLAAGSMIASTHDLTRFGQMMLNDGRYREQTILDTGSIQAMLTRQNTRSPLDGDFEIGLGFWLNGSDILPASVPMASHGGDLTPYHGFFLLLPEHDLTMAILVNSPSSSTDLGKLAQQLAALYLQAEQRLPSDPPKVVSSEPLREKADGVYAMPFGFTDLTYRDSSDTYRVESSFVTFRGVARDDGRWGLEYRLLGLFDVTPGGFRDLSIRFGEWQDAPIAWLYASGTNLGMMVPAESVSPSDLWLSRTGQYQVTNDDNAMFESMRIEWDSDRQILFAGPHFGFGMGMAIPATPLDRNRLQLQGYGRNLGDILYWTGPDRFRYSGLNYEKR